MATHQTHWLRPRNPPQCSQALREWCSTERGVWEFEVGIIASFIEVQTLRSLQCSQKCLKAGFRR